MAQQFFFITHPNVIISKDVPVPRWPLSDLGRSRMQASLRQPWVNSLQVLYCSTEQKAIDAAKVLADHLSLSFTAMQALGENDRSSTGFLPPAEFEEVAAQFFAQPGASVRGWERAADAQDRIFQAVDTIAREERSNGPIGIVSHGAVGTLLYCHLMRRRVSRQWDQPANGGGNYFPFTLRPRQAQAWWRAIDEEGSG